jgi:hypothetical protein
MSKRDFTSMPNVFWTNASIDAQALQLWLDTYQTGKDFKRKGIVEVIVS